MYRTLLNDWKCGEYFKKNIMGWIWLMIWSASYIPYVFLEIRDVRGSACYFALAISMSVGVFLTRACPNRIGKTLLLCPMRLVEKKQHIYKGFGIRILFSLASFLVLNIPIYIFADMNKMNLLIEFVYYLIYIIGLNVYVPPVVSSRSTYEKKYNLPRYYNFWESFHQVVGIFGVVVMVDIFRLKKHELLDSEVIMVGIFLMIEILCVVILLVKYFKPVMEQAMQCESYMQEEKKE